MKNHTSVERTLTASVLACMTCASSCHGCRCGGALPPVVARAMYASIRARLPASSMRSIACKVQSALDDLIGQNSCWKPVGDLGSPTTHIGRTEVYEEK